MEGEKENRNERTERGERKMSADSMSKVITLMKVNYCPEQNKHYNGISPLKGCNSFVYHCAREIVTP